MHFAILQALAVSTQTTAIAGKVKKKKEVWTLHPRLLLFFYSGTSITRNNLPVSSVALFSARLKRTLPRFSFGING